MCIRDRDLTAPAMLSNLSDKFVIFNVPDAEASFPFDENKIRKGIEMMMMRDTVFNKKEP